MTKNLRMIISEIANINLQGLQKILDEGVNVMVEEDQLERFLQNPGQAIKDSITAYQAFWETVKIFPGNFYQVNSYQLGICAHILFHMESEWVQDNPEGVVECWDVIDQLYQKFHLETKLLWTLQNLSTVSMN